MCERVEVPANDRLEITGGTSATDLYEALADSRRRVVLSSLLDRDLPVDLITLARRVAADEAETSVEAVSGRVVERTRISLYHVHLPKLADSGLIDYDRERKEVTDVRVGLEPVLGRDVRN